MKALITVAGFTSKHKAKSLVKVGDVLTLVQDPTNKFDSNAVNVYLGTVDEENRVGFVAKSSDILQEGCKTTAEIKI